MKPELQGLGFLKLKVCCQEFVENKLLILNKSSQLHVGKMVANWELVAIF